MAKKFFKKWLPDSQKIRDSKYLRILGPLSHNPNLWHLNRYSVATAFSIGFFCAWIPLPMHMLLAALLAVLFRANLPLAVSLVWVVNPITMVPLFFFAYELGAKLLGIPIQHFHFEMSFEWLLESMHIYAEPLGLGCLVLGTLNALLGNIFVRVVWRHQVVKHWKQRQLKRLESPAKMT
jgi:uncharacterized protein (DUF2062 family)